MKRLIIAFAASCAAVGIAPALAQAPTQGTRPHAAQPSHHSERAHSRAEIPAHVRTLFERLDRNRDGFIAREEAQAGRSAMRERIRGAKQARGARAANRGMAAFDRLDLNRDGAITRDEFARGMEQRAQRRAARQERGGRGVMRLGGRMFDMADVNRDGRVSVQEATNAAYRHFDASDLNRDGRLTREERQQSRQRLRAERRGG